MFEHTSRYFDLKTVTLTLADGRIVAYKRRRFLPQGAQMTLLVEVVVRQGDRLDLIAARTLGDPTHFWRICDAQNAMEPDELTAEAGRMLRIPVPQP